HHLGLLGRKLLLELDFLRLRAGQIVLLAADEEVPANQQYHRQHQGREEKFDRTRPSADVVAVEVAQIVDQFHCAAPPSLAGAAGFALASGAAEAEEAGAALAADAGVPVSSVPLLLSEAGVPDASALGLSRCTTSSNSLGVRLSPCLFSVLIR